MKLLSQLLVTLQSTANDTIEQVQVDGAAADIQQQSINLET